MNNKLLPVLVLLSALFAAMPAAAGEFTVAASIEGAKLTRELVEGDELVKKHCTGCHTEGRIMAALQTMQRDQSENYEKQLKSIIARKIRLTNGDISRQDGKKIMDYLVGIRQLQKPVAALAVSVPPNSTVVRSQQAATHIR
jgi:mono/diheme cytochrome c family protein